VVAATVRTYEITILPGSPGAGTKVRRSSSDPGRMLLTGNVGGPARLDDWQKLDVPSLYNISNTAPYFSNNSAATLDDVLDLYTAFFRQVQVNNPSHAGARVISTDGVHADRPFTPAERPALLAYLNRL
jgi:cytochrome c peroxidase